MTGQVAVLSSPAGAGLGLRLVPLALFVLFFSLYSIYPANYPHHDELYHVIAGAAWATDGTFALGDGTYERTTLYTMLVGELFRWLGVSLPVARLPAIVASSLCVTVVYVFARPAGRLEAAVAAVGFGLCPLFADIAKMTRFYAVHALLFLLAAIAIHWALTRPQTPRGWIGWAGFAALCLGGALYFQLTTVIGLMGIGMWAAAVVAFRTLGWTWNLLLAVSVGFALGAVLLFVALQTGLLAEAIGFYRSTAPWAAERADYEGFYLDLLLGYYPVLLPLFPLAMIYAFSREPDLTLFCVTVFAVAFVLHTFAGMKTERYITYLMPFFWIILGVASGPVFTMAGRACRAAVGAALAMPHHRRLPKRLVARLLWAGAAGSVVSFAAVALATPATFEKLRYRVDHPRPDWAALADALALTSQPGPVLLTPNALHALYFLGDFHAELGPQTETARSQVGRPLVTNAATLIRIIACNPTGALVADEWRWSHGGVVAPEIRRHAERHLAKHPAGPALNLEIYTWDHGRRAGSNCDGASLAERPLRLQPLAPEQIVGAPLPE